MSASTTMSSASTATTSAPSQPTTTLTAHQCAQLQWCLDDYGQLTYVPTLAGNALFLALFVCGMLAQIGLGIKYRTWGYLVAMIGGIALELIGYIGRIMLHNDILDNNDFIIYLVGLTIGPAFFSAAIYLCLSRIITIFGSELSWLAPKTITLLFVSFDFFSLILQAAGGAMASVANTKNATQTGINIMIAGLSTQVASTTAFIFVCLHIMWAVRKHPERLNQSTLQYRKRLYFRLFLSGMFQPSSARQARANIVAAIGVATVCILVRCCFRVAELEGGFDSAIANNEVEFM